MQHTIHLAPEVEPMTYREFLYELLESDCVSFALKEMIRASIERDPVDALNDAELLVCLLAKRAAPGQAF